MERRRSFTDNEFVYSHDVGGTFFVPPVNVGRTDRLSFSPETTKSNLEASRQSAIRRNSFGENNYVYSKINGFGVFIPAVDIGRTDEEIISYQKNELQYLLQFHL